MGSGQGSLQGRVRVCRSGGLAAALVFMTAACFQGESSPPLPALAVDEGDDAPRDANHFGPEWSPDGTTILFSGRFQGQRQVLVVNADGTDLRALTRGAGSNGAGVWSPDGRRIAFVSERNGDPEIFLMEADGGDPRPLGVTTGGGGERPDWSPDGARIAYHSDASGSWDLWTVGVDGSAPRRLTTFEGEERNPAWSPDGRRIAYMSDRGGDWEVHVISVTDPDDVAVLTDNEGAYDGYPQWSPDGTRIAFISDRGPEWAVFVMDADGSDQTPLTTAPDWNFDPNWSPDGSKIVFSSRRDGRRGLYVMDADGGNQTKLTNTSVSPFIQVVRAEGVEAALARLEQSQARNPEAFFFLQAEARLQARREMDAGRLGAGLALLELNTRAYARRPSAHVEFGEALLAAGDTAAAVASYARARDLDPENAAAVKALEALGASGD